MMRFLVRHVRSIAVGQFKAHVEAEQERLQEIILVFDEGNYVLNMGNAMGFDSAVSTDSMVEAGAPDREIMITAAMLDAGIGACEDWNEDRMRSDVPMRFAYLCDAVY
jgi:hypothetical protein